MKALRKDNALPRAANDDQAAGLRKLLLPARRRMLPLASVLGAKAHEQVVARLDEALAPHGCAVRVMDNQEAWHASRGSDVFVALAGDFESATAAYALVKAAVASHGSRRFLLLFHGAPERAIVSRFKRVTDRFLGIEARLAGVLPRQASARQASDLAAKLSALME